MSAWIFVLACFLHYISFSGADGVSTDGLLSFNEDVDPLQSTSTYLLNPTDRDPELVSNLSVNGDENSDVLANMLPNESDPGSSDLFFGNANADSNPVVDDPTLIADCTFSIINEGYLRDRKNKKARIRRETACHNPYSIPSLPTLDQANKQDPSRPKTDDEKALADSLNIFTMGGASLLKSFDLILSTCLSDERSVCSSGYSSDQKLEDNGESYALGGGQESKCFVSLLSDTRNGVYVLMSLRRSRFCVFLHLPKRVFLLQKVRAQWGEWLSILWYLIGKGYISFE